MNLEPLLWAFGSGVTVGGLLVGNLGYRWGIRVNGAQMVKTGWHRASRSTW